MTLGTVQLGLNYGIANTSGKPSLEKAFEILDTSVAGGVNAFDTASGYGDSEDLLGSYFSGEAGGLRAPFIATKFMMEDGPGLSANEVERHIRGFAEKSLKKLNIEKIPLYMLHRAHDMTRYGDAVPQALKKLIGDGLIERTGVSVYRPEEAEAVLQNGLYEAIQIPMNAFDIRMVTSGVLEKLRRAGVAIFVRSVFLQGLFFIDPESLPEKLAMAAPSLQRMKNLAEEEGLSVAELALAFVRDMEGVTSLVLGAETPGQVAENLKLAGCPRLRPHVRSRLEAVAQAAPIEAIMDAFLKK